MARPRDLAEHAKDLFADALSARAAGDADRALRLADRLRRITPRKPEALTLYAALIEAQDPQGALAVYRQADALLPMTAIRAAIWRCHRALGDEARADAALAAIIALDPTAPEVSAILGPDHPGAVALIKGLVTGYVHGAPEDLTIAVDGGPRQRVTLTPRADGAMTFAHPIDPVPPAGARVMVLARGRALAGAPLIHDGAAPAEEGALWPLRADVVSGWAVSALEPGPARVIVSDDRGLEVEILADLETAELDQAGIAHGRGAFALILPRDPDRGLIRARFASSGRDLDQSPLLIAPPGSGTDPALVAEAIANARDAAVAMGRVAPPPVTRPLAARRLTPRPQGAALAMIDVIVPVYRGMAKTLACLDSLIAGRGARAYEIIVVDDASPEPALSEALAERARAGAVTLLVNERNLGFVGSVNRAMAVHGDRDVVLVNADSLMPGGWLDRLASALAEDPAIGTATPLSSNASILSYPRRDAANPLPGPADLAAIDALAQAHGLRRVIDIPSAVGSCMYIRRACLDDVGPFNQRLFARGYGEENDFSLRARARGWRNVAVTDLYVGHAPGSTSFGPDKAALVARNAARLNALHPGYDALIQDYLRRDPLADHRRAMDLARARTLIADRGPAILMITSDLIGGVARHGADLARALRAEGRRVITLGPARLASPGLAPRLQLVLSDPDARDIENLTYEWPFERPVLVAHARALGVGHVHVQHFLRLPPQILDFPAALGLPYDVTVHDYSWICPRVTLVDASGRYCGEPDLAACEACVTRSGGRLDERIGVAALRARSRARLNAARRVFVPTADAARRLARYAPEARIVVRPHPEPALEVEAETEDRSDPDVADDAAPPVRRPPIPKAATGADPARPRGGGLIRVLVMGAINADKGLEVLEACARDASRRGLPLTFHLVGYTADDLGLVGLETLFMTGPYREAEAPALIAEAAADLAFLPSVCPETWSYTLSHVTGAGLPVVAFDLGAIAQRLREAGGGLLLAQDLAPAAINEALIDFARRAPRPAPACPPGAYPSILRDYYGL